MKRKIIGAKVELLETIKNRGGAVFEKGSIVQEIMVAFEQRANFALGKQVAEGEEVLTVSRNDVMTHYRDAQEDKEEYHPANDNPCNNMYQRAVGRRQMLRRLFGSKCLPDGEPKPTEPNRMEESYSSDHIPDPAKMVDNIIKAGFRDHNRLHVASIIMAGLLASDKDKHPVRRALELADGLIAECESSTPSLCNAKKGDN